MLRFNSSSSSSSILSQFGKSTNSIQKKNLKKNNFSISTFSFFDRNFQQASSLQQTRTRRINLDQRRRISFFKKKQQKNLTTKEIGDLLEDRVVRLFRRLGKIGVRKNMNLRDRHGNLSQLDVVFGLVPWSFVPNFMPFFPRRFVECKHYSRGHLVSLADVAKFKSVLELNGIPVSKGLFITTSEYVPRARTIGIETIDGAQLRALEARSYRVQFLRRVLIVVLAFGSIFAFVMGVLILGSKIEEEEEGKNNNKKKKNKKKTEMMGKEETLMDRAKEIYNKKWTWEEFRDYVKKVFDWTIKTFFSNEDKNEKK